MTRFRGHLLSWGEKGVHDGKTTFDALEFRQQMVELVRVGRKPGELASEFAVSEQAIRNWVKQAEVDAGQRADGLSTQEKEELQRLRRENKQLRTEREILTEAAAWLN